jgi:hypothetical protein
MSEHLNENNKSTAPQATEAPVSAPLIKIRLLYYIANVPATRHWWVQKSLLEKHSGFFRAMFQHQWTETQSGEVDLHDDEQQALNEVISYMSEGQSFQFYNEQKWKSERLTWQPRDPHAHVKKIWLSLAVFKLAAKYPVPALMRSSLAAYAHRMSEMLKYWSEFYAGPRNTLGPVGQLGTFFAVRRFCEIHYDSVCAHNNHKYPKELYPTFASMWLMYDIMADDTTPMERRMRSDPDLAVYVALYLRRKLRPLERRD